MGDDMSGLEERFQRKLVREAHFRRCLGTKEFIPRPHNDTMSPYYGPIIFSLVAGLLLSFMVFNAWHWYTMSVRLNKDTACEMLLRERGGGK